jgi:hypothetical protein
MTPAALLNPGAALPSWLADAGNFRGHHHTSGISWHRAFISRKTCSAGQRLFKISGPGKADLDAFLAAYQRRRTVETDLLNVRSPASGM